MALSVIVERYREYLPITPNSPELTLGEGDTPLIRISRLEELLDERLSKHLGRQIKRDLSVYVKGEHENHSTDSFKDRGMVVAVIKALEEGMEGLLCASTGNTGASAAAYAAAAGMPLTVIVPENIAIGKLSQMMMYGAYIISIKGKFDDALKLAQEIAQKNPKLALVNSVNEYRIEGQKTAAFEICDVLGNAPDYLFLPVGNAGNITAYWKGFTEYLRDKKITRRPRMMGYQAFGADPIVQGHVIEKPVTDASAIKIGNPASWQRAIQARDESGGLIDSVTDEEMYRAQYFLSAESGKAIYVELASATSVAGLLKYDLQQPLPNNSIVVCVVTGSGVKNPEAADKNPFKRELIRLSPDSNPHLVVQEIMGNHHR